MRLLLQSMEARGGAAAAAAETLDVGLPPTATLADVKTLLASKFSLAQPVPAEWIRLFPGRREFVNRRKELVSPYPDAALPSLGLASGDLVFFALCPFMAPPARALPRNPSPGSGAAAAGRLVAVLHAALLDLGFITATQIGSHLSPPQDWPSGAWTIKYTIPKLSSVLSVSEEGKLVVLRYSLMPNVVMVYGYVHEAPSELCELSLELPELEPLLHLDSHQRSGVHEKGVLDLWRVLKDKICLPLMISLCQLNGFSLPPCLMALPADLKTKVLGLLHGVDLAKIECTCKEMRNLASDDSIWKLVTKYRGGQQECQGRICRVLAGP